MRQTKADRIGELEDQITDLKRRNDELRQQRDTEKELVGKLREAIENDMRLHRQRDLCLRHGGDQSRHVELERSG